jgi:calcineurin-like phosphoesterase family protein
MSDIWVISDTHFHHANILNFTDETGELIRGAHFSSVEEMDECMLENWNSVVKPGDKVYHLGDVQMGSKEQFTKFWSRLNGSKRLIVGNHDDIKFLSSGGFFAKVYMWRLFKEFGLLLTHAPIHEQSLYLYPKKDDVNSWDKPKEELLNIHGHIHQNPSPPGRYRCVCVEQINYTPINIEELRIK